MLTFKNEYCKVYYHEDLAVVHVDWSDLMATKDGFCEACEQALQLIADKKVYKMIADNSRVPVVHRENQSWLTDDWFPRAIAKGFRYSAVIIPKSQFVQYTIKKLESNINNSLFTVQYFTCVEDAKVWLSTV